MGEARVGSTVHRERGALKDGPQGQNKNTRHGIITKATQNRQGQAYDFQLTNKETEALY